VLRCFNIALFQPEQSLFSHMTGWSLAPIFNSSSCVWTDSQICERDLEGVVAKRMEGMYGDDWFKIRNPNYSQYEGRRELFEKRKTSGSVGCVESSR